MRSKPANQVHQLSLPYCLLCQQKNTSSCSEDTTLACAVNQNRTERFGCNNELQKYPAGPRPQTAKRAQVAMDESCTQHTRMQIAVCIGPRQTFTMAIQVLLYYHPSNIINVAFVHIPACPPDWQDQPSPFEHQAQTNRKGRMGMTCSSGGLVPMLRAHRTRC